MTCSKCRKPIEPEWSYCPYCGGNLRVKSKGTKTRANGTGTAYKRGKTWTARIVVGYLIKRLDDGTLKTVPVPRTKGGFKTKTEALAYCTALKTEKKQNRVSENESFGNLFVRFEKEYSTRIAKSTMATYKAAFKYYQNIHHEKITELTHSEIQACIDACPRGRSTKNDMRTVCSLVFKFAITNGIDVKNQAENLYCGNEKKGTRRAFTPEELKLIGESVGKLPYADYVYCLCYLGFRPNEMLELEKTSYDAEHRCLIGGFKTEAGRDRIVTISPKILPIIEKQIEADSRYIFPRDDGSLMKDDYFRKHCFNPLMEQLGIEGAVPYSCRHTFANLLKNVRGSDTDKAALIGHSDASMTKYYQSPDYASLRAITDSI